MAIPGSGDVVLLYGQDSDGNLVPLRLNADGTLSGAGSSLELGSIPTTQAIGDAAAAGASVKAAPELHVHGMPSFANPVAIAYAIAQGVAATLPRSDHAHSIGLTTASNFLGGDVTISTANTFFDGPSVSLAAGTWLVVANVSIHAFAASLQVTAKLWDGTTSYSAQQVTTPSGITPVPLAAIITLGGTTTIKASATSTTRTDTLIRAAPANNSPGNFSSWVVAIRVA